MPIGLTMAVVVLNYNKDHILKLCMSRFMNKRKIADNTKLYLSNNKQYPYAFSPHLSEYMNTLDAVRFTNVSSICNLIKTKSTRSLCVPTVRIW